MAREWYVNSGNRIEGPFTSKELAERAASGQLLPTDAVSPDRTKWTPAGKVKGLTFRERPTTNIVAIPAPALDSTDDPVPIGPPKPLDNVPGYVIEGVLGQGGMGIVYRARQVKLDRVVALKTVAVAAVANPAMVQRFEKEAVALAKLQHPNIVSVYDSGRAGDRLFFAMELLEGEDLDQLIERKGPLDERTAWLIARQAAAALLHAANHAITHRDIKPANLFLIPAPIGTQLPIGVPMVKVTDFGLALTRGQADQRLTTTGTVIGTPIYMAPEQFKTSDLDHRADIYALGASMFHALAGRLPFLEPTIWELMLAKTRRTPRLEPPISTESIELVAAMMAGNPADRPASYEELMAHIDELSCLREVANSAPSDVLRRPPMPVPRKKWLLFTAVGAAVFVVAAALSFVVMNRGDAPPSPASVRYVASGTSIQLYISKSVPPWQGTGLEIVEDADQNPVLTGRGTIRRAYDPLPHFRITLGLDLQTAKSLDVVFILPVADAAPRTVLRIVPGGEVVMGTRSGDTFTATGEPIRYPTAEQLDGKGLYREVKFEKVGGVWRVFFEGQPVGSVPDDGTPKQPEFQLRTEGGPIRILSAGLEELMEEK